MERPNLGGRSHDFASIALTVVEKGKEAVAASASFGNQAAWAAAPHAFLGNSQGSGPACFGIPRFGGSSSAVVNQQTGDGSSGQEAARVRLRGAGSDAAGARVCSGEPGLSRRLRSPLAATARRCIGANVAGALPQAFHGRPGFLSWSCPCEAQSSRRAGCLPSRVRSIRPSPASVRLPSASGRTRSPAVSRRGPRRRRPCRGL
jgi:hypothetical protein